MRSKIWTATKFIVGFAFIATAILCTTTNVAMADSLGDYSVYVSECVWEE